MDLYSYRAATRESAQQTTPSPCGNDFGFLAIAIGLAEVKSQFTHHALTEGAEHRQSHRRIWQAKGAMDIPLRLHLVDDSFHRLPLIERRLQPQFVSGRPPARLAPISLGLLSRPAVVAVLPRVVAVFLAPTVALDAEAMSRRRCEPQPGRDCRPGARIRGSCSRYRRLPVEGTEAGGLSLGRTPIRQWLPAVVKAPGWALVVEPHVATTATAIAEKDDATVRTDRRFDVAATRQFEGLAAMPSRFAETAMTEPRTHVATVGRRGKSWRAGCSGAPIGSRLE